MFYKQTKRKSNMKVKNSVSLKTPRIYRKDIWDHGDGFYSVHDTGHIKVSKDGKIMRPDGTIVEGTIYYSKPKNVPYRYYSEKGKGGRGYWLVHRLVAITFLSIPNPDVRYDVNHIDNNGLNNNIDNLEWVTRSENNHHLVITGQTKTASPITVLNLFTKEVSHYHSINQFADEKNIPNGTIHLHIKAHWKKRPFRGHFSMAPAGADPIEFENYSLYGQNYQDKTIVARIKVDEPEGEIEIFPNKDLADRICGTKGTYPQVTNNYKYFYFFEKYNYSEIEILYPRIKINYEKKEFGDGRRRPPREVLVRNIKDGSHEVFKSISAFAEHYRYPLSGVIRTTWRNRGFYKHHQVIYIPHGSTKERVLEQLIKD